VEAAWLFDFQARNNRGQGQCRFLLKKRLWASISQKIV
jgi:hypothetical protein